MSSRQCSASAVPGTVRPAHVHRTKVPERDRRKSVGDINAPYRVSRHGRSSLVSRSTYVRVAGRTHGQALLRPSAPHPSWRTGTRTCADSLMTEPDPFDWLVGARSDALDYWFSTATVSRSRHD